jgi:hypothetical protein
LPHEWSLFYDPEFRERMSAGGADFDDPKFLEAFHHPQYSPGRRWPQIAVPRARARRAALPNSRQNRTGVGREQAVHPGGP